MQRPSVFHHLPAVLNVPSTPLSFVQLILTHNPVFVLSLDDLLTSTHQLTKSKSLTFFLYHHQCDLSELVIRLITNCV